MLHTDIYIYTHTHAFFVGIVRNHVLNKESVTDKPTYELLVGSHGIKRRILRRPRFPRCRERARAGPCDSSTGLHLSRVLNMSTPRRWNQAPKRHRQNRKKEQLHVRTCNTSRQISTPMRSLKCEHRSRSRDDIPCRTAGAAFHILVELPPIKTLRIAGIAAAGRAPEAKSDSKPRGPCCSRCGRERKDGERMDGFRGKEDNGSTP